VILGVFWAKVTKIFNIKKMGGAQTMRPIAFVHCIQKCVFVFVQIGYVNFNLDVL